MFPLQKAVAERLFCADFFDVAPERFLPSFVSADLSAVFSAAISTEFSAAFSVILTPYPI